jgi:hypothetical protein
MEPFEGNLVPLPKVEKTDDPHQIQRLYGHEPDREPDDLVLQRGRERENRREQDDERFDAVAPALNPNSEARRVIPDDIRRRCHIVVKQVNDADTDIGDQGREGQDDVLFCRL